MRNYVIINSDMRWQGNKFFVFAKKYMNQRKICIKQGNTDEKCSTWAKFPAADDTGIRSVYCTFLH